MKRYIIEFSNDMIKRLEESISPLNETIITKRIYGIQHYVKACEKGLITEFETISCIVRILEAEKESEFFWIESESYKQFMKYRKDRTK